jgi:D-arabinose 1-dehydrogenase-like Zn-dependent alcohol dehydrogenase
MLIKIALANVCGSDMHYWRGEQDYVKMGRPLPLNTGHEHVGTVAKLGQGVTTDSTGQPLKVGDRVLYRYFLVGWKAEFDPSWIIFGNRRIIGLAHYEAEHLRGALDLMRRTLNKYPWGRVVSHKVPLEQINEAFAQQDKGHVTRAAIVPN